MAKYIFFQSPTSPFVRKVRILLEELHLMDQVELVKGLDGAKLKEHPNPLIKIPTLVTPDAGVLYESLVIAEYLDHKFAPGRYFPQNFNARLKTLLNHSLISGAQEATVLVVYENRRPANLISAEWVAKQKTKVERALQALAENVDYYQTNWGIDTVALVCFVDYLNYRFPGEYVGPALDELMRWRAGIKNAAVDVTMPKEL